MAKKPKKYTLAQQFVVHPLGCWVWTGFISSHGYGRVGRTGYAHRAFYENYVGPIPEGLQIDHLCRNRACVNPAHMEPVTIAENVLRGESGPARNARKSECIRGHELGGANLYVDALGKRRCMECRRRARRKSYHRMKVR